MSDLVLKGFALYPVHGITNESHKKISVSGLSFEPEILRILSRSANHLIAKFGKTMLYSSHVNII
jgi:hypothetical protein